MENRFREMPSEELIIALLFSKNRGVVMPEVLKRTIILSLVSIASASNLLVDQTGKAGRELVSNFK